MFAKITALIVHEMHTRLVAPVVAEYKAIGQQPMCTLPHAAEHAYDAASTTGANVERAPTWDHDTRQPVRAGFGFTPMSLQSSHIEQATAQQGGNRSQPNG